MLIRLACLLKSQPASCKRDKMMTTKTTHTRLIGICNPRKQKSLRCNVISELRKAAMPLHTNHENIKAPDHNSYTSHI